MKRALIILGLFCWGLMLHAQVIRGLYVNKFDEILGNDILEQDLCQFVTECRLNHVLFYSLHKIDFKNPLKVNQLRSLIRRLRTQCGVKYVGAVHESYERFEYEIHPYNVDPETDSLERFNVYNVEFEYWSESVIDSYYCERYLRPVGFPCTEAGAFMYVEKSLKALQQFKKVMPELTTEVYIGWVDSTNGVELSGIVDRVLPATYRSANAQGEIDLYYYGGQRDRLRYLASGGITNILPIFNGSKNDSDANLYSWLYSGHSICEPWSYYYNDFLDETDTLIRNRINPQGYVWFKYFSLPDVPHLLIEPSPIEGPVTVFVYEEVQYSVPEVPGADQYIWSFENHQRKIITGAGEISIVTTFEIEGNETLTVQAFGCGKKSSPSVKYLDVQKHPSGIDLSAFEHTQVRAVAYGDRIQCVLPIDKPNTITISIIDLMGKTMENIEIQSGDEITEFFSRPLPAGVYVLSARGKNLNHSQKIAIVR